MIFSFRSLSRSGQIGWIVAILFSSAAVVCAQAPACSPVAARAATPADTAYSEGRYADAESLYQQALAGSPQDADLSAALVRTLLHENKVAQAYTQANTALAANPHAASALAALAEVQLRQGFEWPWHIEQRSKGW